MLQPWRANGKANCNEPNYKDSVNHCKGLPLTLKVMGKYKCCVNQKYHGEEMIPKGMERWEKRYLGRGMQAMTLFGVLNNLKLRHTTNLVVEWIACVTDKDIPRVTRNSTIPGQFNPSCTA